MVDMRGVISQMGSVEKDPQEESLDEGLWRTRGRNRIENKKLEILGTYSRCLINN